MGSTLHGTPEFWLAFHVVVLIFLALDLKYARGVEHSLRLAAAWSALWIALGLALSVYIYEVYGAEEFVKYIVAYATEKLLSVDNLFVFLAVFTYFSVPDEARHVVLFLGIVTAIVFRFAFIYAGVSLLERYHWVSHAFGAVLIYSGYRMARGGGEPVDPGRNRVVQLAKRYLPVTDTYSGVRFAVRGSSKIQFTPLILALLAIETTDIMFAFDSIPAVLAVTREFFTAYSSNVMAVLGLRSLYFVLEHGVRRIEGVGRGLSIYLVYLGAAFILSNLGVEVPPWASLLLISAILAWLALRSRGGRSGIRPSDGEVHGERPPASVNSPSSTPASSTE